MADLLPVPDELPSSFTEELARYLFIWIGILGAAYASGQQTHLAIDILPPKLIPTTAYGYV